MVSIVYKWLMLFTWVNFTMSPVASEAPVCNHPLFVSVTEIEHNAKDKTLEISCKIFTDDFENSPIPWNTVLGGNATMLVWQKGKGYLHHLEDAHSGKNAWHTSKSNNFNFSSCGSTCNIQYVESPYIDLSSG
ncbi:MAG: DUF6702 family protein, partial [Ferruginibacter sp.]